MLHQAASGLGGHRAADWRRMKASSKLPPVKLPKRLVSHIALGKPRLQRDSLIRRGDEMKSAVFTSRDS